MLHVYDGYSKECYDNKLYTTAKPKAMPPPRIRNTPV